MEIKSLADIGFDTIFDAFAEAFADYEVQLDKTQLQRMLTRRGFDPELSFAAFDGDRIVAFTLNGVGDYNGVRTAYDTGTGTLEAYRGQGLATRIFEHSIPLLKQAGIGQYLLEVLQHNTKAVSIYRNLGFEVTREFNYFIQEKDAVRLSGNHPVFPCHICEIRTDEYDSLPGFRDFRPSWQNSFESLARAAGDVVFVGVFAENTPIGYCAFEPESGDIAQIAVDKRFRRQGVGTLLLREAIGRITGNQVKIINTDVSCDTITRFLEQRNITLKGKQFEMIKHL